MTKLFRGPLCFAALAAAGLLVGSNFYSLAQQDGPGTVCPEGGTECGNYTVVQGTCQAGFLCQSSTQGTFYACMPAARAYSCTNDGQDYGLTRCVGNCTDAGSSYCFFQLEHCF